MYQCVIRWSNDSSSKQDWQIYPKRHEFELQPSQHMNVNCVMRGDYTFQIAVSSDSGIAAGSLKYTARNNSFELTSNTPHEFDLEIIDNTYIVRCYLDNMAADTATTGSTSGGTGSTSTGSSGSSAGSNSGSGTVSSSDSVEYTPTSLGHETQFANRYPAYQLYMDNRNDVYCSPIMFNSHAEAKQWIRACIHAHPGTSCHGRPWLSHEQEGIIWP